MRNGRPVVVVVLGVLDVLQFIIDVQGYFSGILGTDQRRTQHHPAITTNQVYSNMHACPEYGTLRAAVIAPFRMRLHKAVTLPARATIRRDDKTGNLYEQFALALIAGDAAAVVHTASAGRRPQRRSCRDVGDSERFISHTQQN